jgi:hypothetical protein
MIDTGTGKLDWAVNGYETWSMPAKSDVIDFAKSSGTTIGSPGSLGDFHYGEMKFPDGKIGDAAMAFVPASAKPAATPTPPPLPSMKPQSPPPLKPAKVNAPPPIRPPTPRW